MGKSLHSQNPRYPCLQNIDLALCPNHLAGGRGAVLVPGQLDQESVL